MNELRRDYEQFYAGLSREEKRSIPPEEMDLLTDDKQTISLEGDMDVIPSPENDYITKLSLDEIKEIVFSSKMRWISPRNKEIFLRYMQGEDKRVTFEKLAKEYKLSRPRIEQIVNRIKRSFRYFGTMDNDKKILYKQKLEQGSRKNKRSK
jgi:DNA-directed RNA polymerase sigma subunit (sigma70/sigma32)